MSQTQPSNMPLRPMRTSSTTTGGSITTAPTVSDAFVSVGCVSVRRYANQYTVYPMWPQGIEKSRVELRVICNVDPSSTASLDSSGNTVKQRAFRTAVRMSIRTCDGVQPACSIEFTSRGQNVIPDFWDRATLIRGSSAIVAVSVAVSSALPTTAATSQQKTISTTIPAVTVLLIFDVRRDAKMFEEFLSNVFESESGLLSKTLQRSLGKNSTGKADIVDSRTAGPQANGKSSSNRTHRGGGGGDGLAVSTAGSRNHNKRSCFDERTDESSSSQYFQFYSYLSQQQNMLQDYLRTATYQRAILSNLLDFLGKTVMDVGAGSGILSYFAVQAGARKVYAVEASSMAVHCRRLIEANGMQDKIICINKKLEEIDTLGPAPGEMVDLIISEPLGYMLVNERMLETYLHAKKFLKPGGNMYPSQADLHCAPFCDESLYMEQLGKANFWHQNNFYGIDLSSLRSAAFEENFRQPIVDTFDMRILMAPSIKYTIDFLKTTENDLHRIHIPVEFVMHHNGTVHGLCFWFDAAFRGSEKTVWLSTAPSQPLTHWYQVRCLLQQPLYCIRGQTLYGSVTLTANARQSYDIEIMLTNSTTGSVATNQLDLKSPCFRMFAAAAVAASATTTTAAVSNTAAAAAASSSLIMQQSTTALPALLVQQQQQQPSPVSNIMPPYSPQATTAFAAAGSSSSFGSNSMPLTNNAMFVAGNSTNYNFTPQVGNSATTTATARGLVPSSSASSSTSGSAVFQPPFRFSSTATAGLHAAGSEEQQQQQQTVMSSFHDLILQQQQQQQQQQAAAGSTVGEDFHSSDDVNISDALNRFGAGNANFHDDSLANDSALTANGGNAISAMLADVVITSPNSYIPTTTFAIRGQSSGGNNRNNVFNNSNKIITSPRSAASPKRQPSNSPQSSHHHHHHRREHHSRVVNDGDGVTNGNGEAAASNGAV